VTDRPITLFTGQWADLPLAVLAEKAAGWGYDGLELACWGDHFDVQRAVEDDGYCESVHDLLASHGLAVYSISNHLVGQAVCDPIDERHSLVLPERVWGDGKPEAVRNRAAAEMQATGHAAAALGVAVVNGFTGSPIWGAAYAFPPHPPGFIDAGFREFADRWGPILDTFEEVDVRFALEVHPTEIAFDISSAARALDAVSHRASFGFNYDPSHLAYQSVDYVRFILEFGDRIYHAHMKDVWWSDRPMRAGVFGGHLEFGHADRAWDFRSIGRGRVDFEEVVRALNRVGYAGPLSIEWEDSGMDREHGAREACDRVRSLAFPSADGAFDAAFSDA
jgi:sugar phosphate isomerase/epimerase